MGSAPGGPAGPRRPPAARRCGKADVRCRRTHGGHARKVLGLLRWVSFGRYWYLVAWDLDRRDWRSFRVDRLVPRPPAGPRFPPREAPDGDVAAYLARQLSARVWPYRATVRVPEPADAVSARIWPGMGVVAPVDERSCTVHVGADTVAALVWMITSLDADFRLVEGPPELAGAFRAQARRCREAVGG
ncbi:WYL domain-containing protein [Blastococcus sp. SYSU DS0552]